MIAMGLSEGLERRRHADRLIADVVDITLEDETIAVAGFAFDQGFPHVGAHAARRGRVEVVVDMNSLGRKIGSQAAEAGDAAHQRVDDGLDQGSRDSGIDGVTPGSQDVSSGLGGLGLRCYDHALRHLVLQSPRATLRR